LYFLSFILFSRNILNLDEFFGNLTQKRKLNKAKKISGGPNPAHSLARLAWPNGQSDLASPC
jgi:hypothetical protein